MDKKTIGDWIMYHVLSATDKAAFFVIRSTQILATRNTQLGVKVN